ncbi:MAG: hypothetical protein KDI07_09190 [Anaerolineae bacterium]|nr:hypothetical protein [Anaerolineae bacterium]MCB9131086.1 hypothetical protein [Anaerolineales bacterium]MCB0230078.1 hypothetical protein [Anaerolineae bacterium]MCB0233809.1 hypothetical protein [Anaerolineae bacterium]MCB0240864.1 hypothetical protein [Anaerolineae bacterium]
MLFLFGGFAVLLAELLITNHTDGIQLVAVAASLIGMILAVIGLVASPKFRRVVAVLFLLLSVTGIIGVIEHNEGGEEGERAQRPALTTSASGAVADVSLRLQGGDTDNDGPPPGFGANGFRPEGGSAPPPLAPLSLAGLALMGTVVMLGWRDKP